MEYIGLTIDRTAGTVKSRVYLKEGGDQTAAFAAPYPALLARFEAFTALPGVQLCDVSDSLRGGAVTNRLIFKLPKRMDRETELRIAEAFFAAAGAGIMPKDGCPAQNDCGTAGVRTLDLPLQVRKRLAAFLEGGCTLYQLGAEFEDGQACAYKYYLHAAPETVFGRQADAPPVMMAAAPVMPGKAPESAAGSLKPPAAHGLFVPSAAIWRDHAAICANGFKPAFIGVNDDGAAQEVKLYYITKALGFKTAYLTDHMNSLAAALGLEAVLPVPVLEEILDLGLYPEGLALSLQEERMVRLYFTGLQ